MIMIGYEIVIGNGSIVCQCVWSRTIVIGYDIAVIAGGHYPGNFSLSHSVGKMKCQSQNAEHKFA